MSGGSSGQVPLFTGSVRDGFLGACAIDNVFTGRTVAISLVAMKVADAGSGVLCFYGNYGGDRINFDLAGEMREDEDIVSTIVLGDDDIANAQLEETE